MKTCLQCHTDFEIKQEELDFYEKVSPVFHKQRYLIPPPSYCPDCRLQIRTAHRNEEHMYNTKSAANDKPLISIYSPDKPYKIYSQDYWFSDHWDPFDYGRDFDFSRSFFEQFHELSMNVPKANMVTVNNENSDYTTGTGFCKNCYIINSSEYCEDCYYGKLLQTCKNIIDSSYIYDSELLYGCFNVRNGYNCHYVYNSQTVRDCSFCDNLNKCHDCFLCTNLSMKEYCFENQQLTKETYREKIKEFLGYTGTCRALKSLQKMSKERIHKYGNIINPENVSGDFIRNCKNCTNCFDINDSEDCRHVHVGVKGKDLFDCSNMYINPQLSYQVLGTIETFNVHFCLYVFHSSDLLYCEYCYSSKNCFGCSGLRNKQYCILNKQYTREEYETLVPRIIEHMMKTPLIDPKGCNQPLGSSYVEWGLFFPVQYAAFGYNESLAYEYFPLTKQEALSKGFNWSDYESPPPTVEKVITSEQMKKLPDNIEDIPDDILNWALTCEVTGKLFRIIKQELKFYRDHNLPIPRRHPDQRHKDRMALRNPRRLWTRQCDCRNEEHQHSPVECRHACTLREDNTNDTHRCPHTFQTTYSPDRAEKVYCEECYLKEVY